MVNASRIIRGRETQEILAEDLRHNGAPDAEAVPSARRGRDILKVPGLAIEVKARADFQPLKWIRQAVKNAKGDYPIVVFRCNGQGPQHVDEWPVIMRWGDFKDLLREGNYLAGDSH